MQKIIPAIKNFLTSAAYHTLSALIYVVESVKAILVLVMTIAFTIFAVSQGKKQAKKAYDFAKQIVFGAPAAKPNASSPQPAGVLNEGARFLAQAHDPISENDTPSEDPHLVHNAKSKVKSLTSISIPMHEKLSNSGLSK